MCECFWHPSVIHLATSVHFHWFAGKLGPGAAGAEGLQLIWPTVWEIRDSVEGWRGGASVPGPAKNVNKPFLRPFWHK